MKTFFLLSTFVFCFNVLFAQDIIYTIVGKIESETTSIDSINVINISSETEIGFGNLPVRDDYRINFTRKSFWGSTSNPSFISQENFYVIHNIPGELSIGYKNNFNSKVQISVFNINGQRIKTFSDKYSGSNKVFNINISTPGVYLVTTETNYGRQTFKAFGQKGYEDVKVTLEACSNNTQQDKSVSTDCTEDFQFNIGDSLIITAFKEGYIADPISSKATSNKTLNFQFKIPLSAPSLLTLEAKEITKTSAKLNGQITSDGGSNIIERGFYVSRRDTIPGKNNTIVKADNLSAGIDSFSAVVNGLFPDLTYYVRAYATNSLGTVFGEIISFNTNDLDYGTFIDPRDSIEYKTIEIGKQTWMAENLAWLPAVNPISKGSNSLPYYYVYDYSGEIVSEAKETDNYKIYGVLYNWSAAMDACPAGWHLPNMDEWKIMDNYLDNKTDTWIKIKETGNNYWLNQNDEATNESGFSGLPGGSRVYYGICRDIGENSDWWSSTEYDSKKSYSRALGGTYFSKSSFYKEQGYSVRCIMTPLPEVFVPTVSTANVSSILNISAISGGNVTSDGGAETTRGVCWNTTGNPTISDNKTVDGTGTGSFTSNITNLTPNTNYTVRAYATNRKGTAYGEEIKFKTKANEYGSFTDSRDGQIYHSVEIGEQTWMVENLAYLPKVSSSISLRSYTEKNYYIYEYTGTNVIEAKSTENYKNYGVLYNWPAAIDDCPSGWHLPSQAEWIVLTDYLGNSSLAGGKLKETGTTHWKDPNTGATNESDFSALPGGFYMGNDLEPGSFFGIEEKAEWWSSEELYSYNSNSEKINARYWYLRFNSAGIDLSINSSGKQNGYSVRCIMDENTSGSIPTVSSDSITDITKTSAVSYGNVTSDGGAPVTCRGICWNTTGNPSVTDNEICIGTGTGSYKYNMTGLVANTTYYVKAYAKNSKGIAYGNEIIFTTKPTLAVTTNPITEITQTTAITGGNVISDGGFAVTARGICWNTYSNPTTYNNKTTDNTGIGSYTSTLNNLIPNTTYYVKAYVTNSQGTTYGEERTFKTPDHNFGSFTDPRDGHTYKTIVIKGETWMAENLAYLPQVSPPSEISSTEKHYYVYGYEGSDVEEAKATKNYETYGVLYNWQAAADRFQGVCPAGWSLPSDLDFDYFKTSFSNNGNKFKEIGTAHWEIDPGSTNETGFTALPGGCLGSDGSFYDISKFSYFWSGRKYGDTNAWGLAFGSDYYSIVVFNGNVEKGQSVRCVKEE